MGSIRVLAKSDSSLDIYFKDISKTRGTEAQDALVTENLKLVVHFAKKYRQNFKLSADDMTDLIQAGNIGLIEAAKNYRNRGKQFSTYASYYIRSAILQEIDNFGLVRLPENKRKELRKAAAAVRYLEQEGYRNPGDTEIACFLGWEPQKVREISLLVKTSQPVQNGQIEDGACAPEAENYRLDPAELCIRKERVSRCREALSALPSREKAVLELRYGFLDGRYGFLDGRYRSMEETGKWLGITRQSVCEIEARAKKRLRKALWDLEDTQPPGSIAA
jgi:RNA polymerase sigma factor (sigma-70 family)